MYWERYAVFKIWFSRYLIFFHHLDLYQVNKTLLKLTFILFFLFSVFITWSTLRNNNLVNGLKHSSGGLVFSETWGDLVSLVGPRTLLHTMGVGASGKHLRGKINYFCTRKLCRSEIFGHFGHFLVQKCALQSGVTHNYCKEVKWMKSNRK